MSRFYKPYSFSGGPERSYNPDRSFNRPGLDSFLSQQDRSGMEESVMGLGEGTPPKSGKEVAREFGYRPVPGGFLRGYTPSLFGGIPNVVPEEQLRSFGREPEIDPMLVNAFLNDVRSEEAAREYQWNRIEDEIQGMRDYVSGIEPKFMKGAEKYADLFEGLGKESLKRGEEALGQARKFRERESSRIDLIEKNTLAGLEEASRAARSAMATFGRSEADVNKAYELASEATKYAEKVKNETRDKGIEAASSAAFALQRNADLRIQQEMQNASLGEAGMSDFDMQKISSQIRGEALAQSQTQITQIQESYNALNADLGKMVVSMKQNEAAVRLQGAEQKRAIGDSMLQGSGIMATLKQAAMGVGLEASRARSELFDREQRAREFERQSAEFALGAFQQAAQTFQAAQFRAVELTFNGLNAVADYVRGNPKSVTSWFQGILGLMSAGRAVAPSTAVTVLSNPNEAPGADESSQEQPTTGASGLSLPKMSAKQRMLARRKKAQEERIQRRERIKNLQAEKRAAYEEKARRVIAKRRSRKPGDPNSKPYIPSPK